MIEVRVPLSPTPAFLNRLLLLAASVREFYPDCAVKAYIGQEGGYFGDEAAGERVRNAIAGRNIDVVWCSKLDFDIWKGTRSPFLGTMDARWHGAGDADAIIIADCDVLVTGGFDELLDTNLTAGVMTHVPPMPAYQMRALWSGFVGHLSYPEYTHSGAGIMCEPHEASPWYVNSGFCYLPRAHFERMIESYHEAIGYLRRVMADTYWFDQLALGLAAAKAEVGRIVLPLRYNFPNQAAFDQAHPDELADCRFLHYLRTDIVDRDRDFADVPSMHRFISRPGLTGSNRLLQQRVGELLGKLWPHPEYDAADAPYA